MTAATDPTFESVQRAVDCLQSAVSQSRLYGFEHPEAHAALQRLQASVNGIGQWLGALELQTSVGGFVWRGTTVREETDDRAGIGRHLHVEGVASLVMEPGIETDELARLLQALGANLSLPLYEEETLESLLYQAELPHVSFDAVSELMDAEALSGRANELDVSDHTSMLNQIVEMHRMPGEPGRDLGAMARGERAPVAPLEADIWGLVGNEEDIDDADDWAVRFAREGAEDATAIGRMRVALERERESELVARAVGILFRAAVSRLDELPASDAMDLAANAMRQLYRMGDAVGLFAAIDSGTEVARRMTQVDPEMRQLIRGFLAEHVSPIRIGRMLRELDPQDPVEHDTVQRVLAILPEPAVLAFLDGLRVDEPTGVNRRLRSLAARSIGRTMLAALGDVARAPADRLLPLVQLVPEVVGEQLEAWIRGLLNHPASQIREAALLLVEAEVIDGLVHDLCGALLDNSRAVRLGAVQVLTRVRPPSAAQRIESIIGSEQFISANRAVRTDLCVAYARLGAIRAQTRLEDLLSVRIGILRNKSAIDTVYAAAHALADLGSPNARAALEKGSRSLASARRAACTEALAIMDLEA